MTKIINFTRQMRRYWAPAEALTGGVWRFPFAVAENGTHALRSGIALPEDGIELVTDVPSCVLRIDARTAYLIMGVMGRSQIVVLTWKKNERYFEGEKSDGR